MYVIGIDPGDVESALVVYESVNNKVEEHHKLPNKLIQQWLIGNTHKYAQYGMFGIERIASYGMPVGETVFETVFWSGVFYQEILHQASCAKIYRPKRKTDICKNLCQNSHAKDPNIRQALIDRLGPQGTKKNPGPTYGVAGDEWAALAVAVTCFDLYFTGDTKF